MQRHDRPRRSRLTEGDVGDRPAAAHDADPALASAGVGGDAVEDVAAAGHLQDVRPEGVGALPCDDHRWFGPVLGAGRAAAWAACDDVSGVGGYQLQALAAVFVVGGGEVVVVFIWLLWVELEVVELVAGVDVPRSSS